MERRTRDRNAANNTRCTAPWSTVARPLPRVSVPTVPSAEHEQYDLHRGEAEHQREIEEGRNSGDHGDGQSDAREPGAECEIQATLHAVGLRGTKRRAGFGQKDEQRDHDPCQRFRRAHPLDARLESRRERLRETDHAHERHEQEDKAHPRDRARGRLGVRVFVSDLDGQKVIAVPKVLHEHEHAVQGERCDPGEDQLRGAVRWSRRRRR